MLSFGIRASMKTLVGVAMLIVRSLIAGPLSSRVKLIRAFRDGDPIIFVPTKQMNVSDA